MLGRKDNLVLHVFLLRNGRSNLASYMQVREMQNLIILAQSLIFYQLKYDVIDEPYFRRKRKYQKKKLSHSSKIEVPSDILKKNLQDLFGSLVMYPNHKSMPTINSEKELATGEMLTINQQEEYFEVGSHVKIRWTSDEIGDSGWKPVWYSAEVQSSTIEDDEISVVFASEPKCVYTVEGYDFIR